MGYLGQEASFTGTQNNQRLSTTAAGGQINFSVGGGYSINALDVYRNGIKLSGGRDFRALDGVTVTLLSPANDGDIIEFVTFENFKREDVITGDGDATIRGNVTISGDLGITGSLNATVSNTATAGFATVSGISSALGIGATAVGLNASGIITAISFSGSGANLTGIAATDDVRTNSLVVAGVSTFNNNIDMEGDIVFGTQGDKLIFGPSNYPASGGSIEINVTASDKSTIGGNSGELRIHNTEASNAAFDFRCRNYYFLDENADYYGLFYNGQVRLYHPGTSGSIGDQKFETDAGGVKITGIATADGFSVGDNEYITAGIGSDLVIYHDGSASYIHDNGVGDLNLCMETGSKLVIQSGTSGNHIAEFNHNGAAELFHNGSQKLETATGGINVGVGITMDGNGIAVSGILTCNGVAVGQNAIGARTVQSGGSPSGGSDGDIYYIY